MSLLASAVAVCAGCGPNVCLVSNVPPPPFGARVAAALPTFAPTAPGPGSISPAATATHKVDWIPRVQETRWRFIIVHHSASSSGNAARFDQEHRAQGWDELGYHFVIGNGRGSGDGLIEIGSRWTRQKGGAHCKVRGHPEYNDLGIGICLVGNFNETRPTEAQMQSLAWLASSLMSRYHIPQSRVLGHGMLKPTDCPGKLFDFADLYRRL